MKKIMSVICILVLVCALVPWNALQVQAADPVYGLYKGGFCTYQEETNIYTQSEDFQLVKCDAQGNELTGTESGTVDRANVTHLFVDKSVLDIGNCAFSDCSSLTTIDLSDCVKLKTIGNFAFQNCTGLKTVDFSDCTGLIALGMQAFSGCENLTRMDLSGLIQLRTLGVQVFSNCVSLKTVNLFDCASIRTIGDHVFQNCSDLTVIFVPDESVKGKLPTQNQRIATTPVYGLYQGGNCEIDTSGAVTKDNVEIIKCDGLGTVLSPQVKIDRKDVTHLFINGTVSEIGQTAFYQCTNLTVIFVPNEAVKSRLAADVQNIAQVPVYGLYKNGNCTLDIYDDVAVDNVEILKCDENGIPLSPKVKIDREDVTCLFVDSAVTEIESNAFYKCLNLIKVNFVGDNQLHTIGQQAFFGCAALKMADFSGCANLQTLGNAAFADCSALSTVDFSGCKQLTTIDMGAFAGCIKLTTMDLSDCQSLQTMGMHLFANCKVLETLDLSGCTALEAVGNNTFIRCTSLKTVYVAKGKKGLFQDKVADTAEIIETGSQGDVPVPNPDPDPSLFQLTAEGKIIMSESGKLPGGITTVTFIIAKFDTNNALAECQVVTLLVTETGTVDLMNIGLTVKIGEELFVLSDSYTSMQNPITRCL